MKKNVFTLGALIIFFLGFFSVNLYKFSDNNLHVVMCDVGQGDAIFIRTPSKSNILIDGGPDDSVLDCLNNNLPFWDKKIDLIILTHPHADHLNGLKYVLERYTVLHFVTEKIESKSQGFKSLEPKLAAKNLTAKYIYAGDKIIFTNNLVFTTMWPDKEWVASQEARLNPKLDFNNTSLVELLTYGNFKALFTGDAGVKIEDGIVQKVGKINLLKVPHHGSRTGMSDYFLSSVRPDLALISAGKGNSYGHPAKFSLDLLNKHNIKTLRTDIDGEIEVVTDGKDYWLN